MKRSGTRRPGYEELRKRALKVRNINVNYSALSELHGHCGRLPGATHLTLFGACPWLSYSAPSALSPAFIFRAFGAQFRLFVQSRTRRRVFGRVTTQYALYISVPKRFRGASVKSLGKYEVFSGWVEDIQNYNTEAV